MAQEIYHRSNWGNPTQDWGNVYLNPDLTNELYKRASEYENSWVTDKLLNGVGIKPSIILTPTAYEDGILNSVKPKGGENLLTYSEDFSNAIWVKRGFTVNSTTEEGPYGLSRAIKITENDTDNNPALYYNADVSDGRNRTFSVWGKASENTDIALTTTGNTLDSTISLTTDWQKFEVTSSVNSTTGPHMGGFSTITRASGIVLYFAMPQLQRQTSAEYVPTYATAYKNGDFNFTRGSSATRINELGLVEDVQILSGELVQNGDFEQIGSERVTNGGFDTDSNWVKGAGTTISNGNANFVNATDVSLYQNIGTQYGFVKVEFTVTNYTSGTLNVYSGGNQSVAVVNVSANALGNYVVYVNRSGGNVNIIFGSSDNFTGSIDNVSVKEVGQNWTFGTGWSMGDGKAISDGSANSAVAQNISFNPSTLKIKFDVNDLTQGSVRLFVNTPTFTQLINATSNGSYETTVEVTSGANNLYFYSTNNFIGSIDNVSVIEITDDTDLPRINYTNGEGSLLLEPQSTNLVTYSEDFSNGSWNTARILTPYIADVVSPDGTLNAYTLEISSGETNGGGVYKTGISITGDNSYSVFAKKKTADYLVISDTSTTGYAVYFNLENGTVGTEYNATGQIEYFGNGWYRCTMKYNLTSSGFKFLYVSDIDGQTTNGVQGGDSIYIWGAQVEALSYPTSYIPTNGSTVTRLADVCNNSGSSDLINSTEGVLYAEMKLLQDVPSANMYFGISNGSLANSIFFRFNTLGDIFAYNGGLGSTNIIASKSASEINLTNTFKLALKYGATNSDFSVYINGFEITQSGSFSATVVLGLSKLNFALYDGTSSATYGNVKCVAVFKELLSDTELQKLTTI